MTASNLRRRAPHAVAVATSPPLDTAGAKRAVAVLTCAIGLLLLVLVRASAAREGADARGE